MKKVQKIVSILLCLLLLVLAGCTKQAVEQKQPEKQPEKQTEKQPAKLTGTFLIGAATALTGPFQPYNDLQGKVIDIAIEEINASGILGDAKFKIVREDTVNTPEAANQAVINLLSKHKVQALFGAPATFQSVVCLPQAADTKMIVFSPNMSRNVTKLGDTVFGVLPAFTDLITAATADVVKKLNIKSAALVVQKDSDSSIANNTARKIELDKAGVKVVAELQTLVSDTDFTALITQILKANPDAVWTGMNPPADPLFIAQLKRAGYKGKILGCSGDGSDTIYSKYAETYEGMYNIQAYLAGAANASQKQKDFEAKIKAKYPDIIVDQFIAGYYDSFWMLAEAIKQAGTLTDNKAISEKLRAIKYEGVRGTTSFDKDRMPNASYIIIQVKNGKSTAVI